MAIAIVGAHRGSGKYLHYFHELFGLIDKPFARTRGTSCYLMAI